MNSKKSANSNQLILVTGGAGYIGSHTCTVLIEAGFKVVVVDNLSNSSVQSISRVEQITGVKIPFIKADLGDENAINKIFSQYKINCVIHFAGLKAVGESIKLPLRYYDNNITGTINLCKAMQKFACKTLVFSSSATVYGNPHQLPITEDFPLSATNPYGQSKLIIESILADIFTADPTWRIARLRYFNPVGAHPSGLIGEDPNGIPNNLMPYIASVAIGKQDKVLVFGDDYNTSDGTGVRDYIHIMDLATGHLQAIQTLQQKPQLLTVNLGTGKGYSVLEMIKAFEIAAAKPIPYKIVARRQGDIAACYANADLAKKLLNWQTHHNLASMCKDTWHWQTNNPNGYR